MKSVNIALVGDHKPEVTAHAAIPGALEIAATAAGCEVSYEWVSTTLLPGKARTVMQRFDALWCVPASPYESMDGALEAIRISRESGMPFLGTCGGYQHAVLEYARNVLGHAEADNAEVNPDAGMPLISALSCALVEQHGDIELAPGSLVAELCQATTVNEQYHCSYGVAPEYLSIFDGSNFIFSGRDLQTEPRAFELRDHPFFIGTAYQPERSSLRQERHPLITAFVRAAAGELALCA